MRILIFRIGQIGDTVVAIPAIRAVREAWPEGILTLLYDDPANRDRATVRDVLEGAGLIDRWISYDPNLAGFSLIRSRLELLRNLREYGFDLLIYLAPRGRSRLQVLRDVAFFRAAGIRRHIGTRDLEPQMEALQAAGAPFKRVASEMEHLLKRLDLAGVSPNVPEGDSQLGLTSSERTWARAWLLERRPSTVHGDEMLVAIAPGAKSEDKKWGERRFAVVAQRLVEEYEICPIIVGGESDRAMAERLVHSCGDGLVAAGDATVRQSAALLSYCSAYVGNDSGPMHLAAAVGVPVVAIFSGRDFPGKWEPAGEGHVVIREDENCSGCNRERCLHNRACLRAVQPDRVVEACAKLLEARNWRFSPESMR